MGGPLSLLLVGLGLVAIIEGLALALAGSHLQAMLEALARLDRERRRAIGLVAVALGILMVWIGHG